MRFLKKILLFAVLFYTLNAEAHSPLKVVSSFSILSDLVRAVGGEHILLETIVGPNEDTHVYEPTPKDAKRLAEADLIFINGLGFEGWIERLIETSGSKGKVVLVSSKIRPRIEDQKCACAQESHGSSPYKIDPHAWHSIPNVHSYIECIKEELCQKDPLHREVYVHNAKSYQEKLKALDLKIHEEFRRIPEDERVSVTTHDGFGYLGDQYKIRFLSPVGLSTDSEPSAKTIAHLIDFIKSKAIKVLFLENITSPKLMQQIASETGAKLGPTLYSDALSDEKGPASTYLKMMEHNALSLIQGMS